MTSSRGTEKVSKCRTRALKTNNIIARLNALPPARRGASDRLGPLKMKINYPWQIPASLLAPARYLIMRLLFFQGGAGVPGDITKATNLPRNLLTSRNRAP